MAAPDETGPISRRSLLAFLEAHWRDLTLRDARSLTAEVLDLDVEEPCIKETLTFS
jgi:hypothetical protein